MSETIEQLRFLAALKNHKNVGKLLGMVPAELLSRAADDIAERDTFRKAESRLGQAYLRLRLLIPDALKTPHAPTEDQVWTLAERNLERLVAERDAMRSALVRIAQGGNEVFTDLPHSGPLGREEMALIARATLRSLGLTPAVPSPNRQGEA